MTGSTNVDLLDAADRGVVDDRTALVTGHQTAGRGRLARRWEAPPDANLLVSLLLLDTATAAGLLTQSVGLAAVRGLEALATATADGDPGGGPDGGPDGAGLGLKWPNDVLLGDRKLAGVLAQRSSSSGAVVVGIGLNVGWAPDGAATVRDDLGLDVDPADVLAAMLPALDELVPPPTAGGGSGSPADPGAPRAASTGGPVDDEARRLAYRERLVTLGRRVRAELPGGGSLVGTAHDVDATGRLVVVDDGGDRHVLDAGDVVHLRPADDHPADDRPADA